MGAQGRDGTTGGEEQQSGRDGGSPVGAETPKARTGVREAAGRGGLRGGLRGGGGSQTGEEARVVRVWERRMGESEQPYEGTHRSSRGQAGPQETLPSETEVTQARYLGGGCAFGSSRPPASPL